MPQGGLQRDPEQNPGWVASGSALGCGAGWELLASGPQQRTAGWGLQRQRRAALEVGHGRDSGHLWGPRGWALGGGPLGVSTR